MDACSLQRTRMRYILCKVLHGLNVCLHVRSVNGWRWKDAQDDGGPRENGVNIRISADKLHEY